MDATRIKMTRNAKPAIHRGVVLLRVGDVMIKRGYTDSAPYAFG